MWYNVLQNILKYWKVPCFLGIDGHKVLETLLLCIDAHISHRKFTDFTKEIENGSYIPPVQKTLNMCKKNVVGN